jgi:hypothetical protein
MIRNKQDLYSCDFKVRKKFENVLKQFIPDITETELKTTTQLTIWDNKKTIWQSPCGIGKCINSSRCIKEEL